MADLFGEIMGEATAIKGIPMPAPPLTPMSDDMQGECFHTLSSSRRATQCPVPTCLAVFHHCGWGPFYIEGSDEGLLRLHERGGVG